MKAIFYAIAIFTLSGLAVSYPAGADTVPNLLPTYEKLSNALFQDDLAETQRMPRELAAEAKKTENEAIGAHAADLEQSDSLFEARREFKTISAAIIEIARGKVRISHLHLPDAVYSVLNEGLLIGCNRPQRLQIRTWANLCQVAG